jgi:hypothetical protein
VIKVLGLLKKLFSNNKDSNYNNTIDNDEFYKEIKEFKEIINNELNYLEKSYTYLEILIKKLEELKEPILNNDRERLRIAYNEFVIEFKNRKYYIPESIRKKVSNLMSLINISIKNNDYGKAIKLINYLIFLLKERKEKIRKELKLIKNVIKNYFEKIKND